MEKKPMIEMDYIDNIKEAKAKYGALIRLEAEILESPEYKLLYGKTQMFYDGSGRSRGGHSANIGQTSGAMAGKAFEEVYGAKKTENTELYAINKAINETIGRIMGYSHDLGHTPLGHDGESVLDKKLEEMTRENPELKEKVAKKREKMFGGIKVEATGGNTEYAYEEYQEGKRTKDAGIGFEHNEYSAEIFLRIVKELKDKVMNEDTVKALGLKEDVVDEILNIDETRFVQAILAHSRSRFPSVPKDFLAQIVRQADKVEYMNYDYEEYKKLGFFPKEGEETYSEYLKMVEERAKAAGVDSKEVLEYFEKDAYERRKIIEKEIIAEAMEKGMIDDNMDAMKMPKICSDFKDDAIFYTAEDGKRGLITGNNVEREEIILDKLFSYYFAHPEKIPAEEVKTELKKLRSDEGELKNGEEIVSYDPSKIDLKETGDYDKIKVYIASLTNEQCESLYLDLVRERIENGKGHGIEPVTKEEVSKRIKSAKEDSENGNSKFSIEHSKKVSGYLPPKMKKRIEKNREKHAEEVENDQILYDKMVEADKTRKNDEKIETQESKNEPTLLASAIEATKESVTDRDVKNIAGKLLEVLKGFLQKKINEKEEKND